MKPAWLTSAAFYRKLTLVCYPGLLFFVILWHALLEPNEFLSTWLVLVIWVTPLLFPLKGILQGNPYTHAWANFILIFYFLHSLTTLWTHPDERLWAAIELLLTTGAFIGATYYARYRGRELGLGIKRKKDEAVVTNAGKSAD
ncbi:DUF2069 domain-containing protein [Aliidiomarina haloalkalitolerans]|uniref:DUF2069 domain-containing protein n=1 Tax=Aliidiomarina haloalkalitolerans TaxID=859059 RepID=A0A432VYX6_9GAMM|nr:DUF2069 domain-containing protein [Aliidiomarina haloalkalitolerans]RUO21884.1 DUF2069 domain-containing protein [Aliidiomarina haloalkalitolerans]